LTTFVFSSSFRVLVVMRSFSFQFRASLAAPYRAGLHLFVFPFQFSIQPVTGPIAFVRIWRIAVMVCEKDFFGRRRLETVIAIEGWGHREENPMNGTAQRASGIRWAFSLGQFAPNGGEISGMGNSD
jgi:hypothetical protein